MLALLCVLATSSGDLHAQDLWERMFTGPATRRIDAIATTASGTVLASAEGRVFRSDDNGQSWSISDAGLPRDIRLIVGHPSGSVVAIAQPGYNLGYLFVSDDDGRTWRPSRIESAETNNFTTLGISPEGVLYAGNSRHYVTNTSGLFRSTDRGGSWQPFGLAEHYSPVSILTDTGGVIIVGEQDYQNYRPYLARSVDFGMTWTRLEIDNFSSYGDLQQVIRDSSGVYIARSSRGLWRSTDRGMTWARPESASPSMSDLMVMSSGLMVGTIAGGIIVSDDTGRSWDTTLVSAPEISLTCITQFARSRILIAGSTAGIYRSSNGGPTWGTSSTGMPAFTGFGYEFGVGGTMVRTWRAVYHSEDRSHWTRAPFDGPVLADDIGRYFIDRGDSLVQSLDSGVSWSGLGRMPFFHARLVSNRGDTIFAVNHNGGLSRSTDLGRTWGRRSGEVSEGGGDDLKLRGRTGVHARGGLGLATTTDNGETWHNSNHDYTAYVAAVAPDSTCYAIGESYAAHTGLFRLPYGDTTWIGVTGARLPGPVDSVTALIATDDGALFAIWSRRPYRSTDRGMTWSDVSAGLPDEAAGYSLTDAKELTTVVDGYGVYRWIGGSAVAPVAGPESPTMAITGVVPIPARDRVRIAFTLAVSGSTRLELVDALGRLVAVPLDRQPLGGGTHEALFDVGTLAPGNYLVVLTSGVARRTSRLLIAR